MAVSHYVIIIGCGRLGGLLANTLSKRGHQVVIVDRDPTSFDKLSAEFSGFKLEGKAVELAVLRQAGIEKADYFFAITTEDNKNLMVAQVAKTIFKVPHVVARVYDPAREAIYRQFGIVTISPTQLTNEAFLKLIKKESAS